jgi:hypothetical protein
MPPTVAHCFLDRPRHDRQPDGDRKTAPQAAGCTKFSFSSNSRACTDVWQQCSVRHAFHICLATIFDLMMLFSATHFAEFVFVIKQIGSTDCAPHARALSCTTGIPLRERFSHVFTLQTETCCS